MTVYNAHRNRIFHLKTSSSAQKRIGFCSRGWRVDFDDYEKFEGIEIKRAITVNRQAAEVYRFWRNPENLPKIMCDVKKVAILDDKRSHWVVAGPLGIQLEWDSELTDDIPEKLLGWRSVGKADVKSMGRVEFASSPAGDGTEVKVSLKYAPPGGRLGFAVARFFGDNPSREVAGCLLLFKDLMETGDHGGTGARLPDAA